MKQLLLSLILISILGNFFCLDAVASGRNSLADDSAPDVPQPTVLLTISPSKADLDASTQDVFRKQLSGLQSVIPANTAQSLSRLSNESSTKSKRNSLISLVGKTGADESTDSSVDSKVDVKTIGANTTIAGARIADTGPIDGSASDLSHFGLSDETFELAKIWGILPALQGLHSSPKDLSSRDMDNLLTRLLVRQEINESVMSKMFDVRLTLNAIDRQVARSDEVRAKLAEKRDRAIRFNTYADLVAGGITGILSSALRLGTLEYITPDVVDVLEGVAQTGLAGIALRYENVKHNMQQGIPNLLAKLFYPERRQYKEFPPSVWQYLNAVPVNSKSKLNRREVLIKRWTDSKFCLVHKGHKQQKNERFKHVTGVSDKRVGLTIDLLEDRVAMLEDLRYEVTTMEEHLSEIFQCSKKY